MSFLTRRGILHTFNPIVQVKRYRGKINIQKPKPPHYERAKYIALTKPFYEKKRLDICDKNIDRWGRFKVENPYQRLLADELLDKLKSSRLVAFYHMNSMTGDEHNKANVLFHRQNMLYKNYGKETLKMAVQGTPYEVLGKWYSSHNMIVFSPDLKIRELLRVNKRLPTLILLAAIAENKFLNVDELQRLSFIPNLQAAQAQFVQTLNSVGNQIVSQLTSHQNTMVSQLQERMKQLEESDKET
ncbi:hypothetical protein Trydic_g10887 [Trypoxylus dichotomus]